MKTRLFTIIGLVVLMSACNWRADRSMSDTPAEPADDTTQQPSESDSELTTTTTDLLWDYQFDTLSKTYVPVKMRTVDADTLTAAMIEQLNNRTWPDVQIVYQKTSGDTIFLSIPNSAYLTQRMGSAGSTQFMASTTYSFTELNGINHVAFTFKEGDHAVPGVYSRRSWDDKNLAVDID